MFHSLNQESDQKEKKKSEKKHRMNGRGRVKKGWRIKFYLLSLCKLSQTEKKILVSEMYQQRHTHAYIYT